MRCASTHEEALEFVQKPDCKTEDSRKSANQSTVTVRHKLLSERVYSILQVSESALKLLEMNQAMKGLLC